MHECAGVLPVGAHSAAGVTHLAQSGGNACSAKPHTAAPLSTHRPSAIQHNERTENTNCCIHTHTLMTRSCIEHH
jgi:hypothetical protein